MQRKHFIDWARGFAVVAMVLWHTADGWLVLGVRSGQGWSTLRFIGGLAAPSFLLLAGLAASLAAKSTKIAQAPLLPTIARGLEVMLFGYALRFQTWLIDAAAARQLALARAWLPLGVGYLLLFFALRSAGSTRARAGKLGIAGALLCLVGFAQVPYVAPGRFLRLLQVDVLQAIGASLVLVTLGERWFRLMQRPLLALAIALAIGSLTQPIADLLPGFLPVPLAAYLGRFPPAAGLPAPALFPLFPWLAYCCIGVAYGTVLRRAGPRGDSFTVLCAVLGALLALGSSEAHDFVQWTIASAPWSVHPLRVAFRVGIVLTLLGVGWLWASGGRGRVLTSYGTASLRIYWAHLLVAYGALGHAWHRRLLFDEWAVRVAALLFLMWLLSKARISRAAQPSHATATP